MRTGRQPDRHNYKPKHTHPHSTLQLHAYTSIRRDTCRNTRVEALRHPDMQTRRRRRTDVPSGRSQAGSISQTSCSTNGLRAQELIRRLRVPKCLGSKNGVYALLHYDILYYTIIYYHIILHIMITLHYATLHFRQRCSRAQELIRRLRVPEPFPSWVRGAVRPRGRSMVCTVAVASITLTGVVSTLIVVIVYICIIHNWCVVRGAWCVVECRVKCLHTSANVCVEES